MTLTSWHIKMRAYTFFVCVYVCAYYQVPEGAQEQFCLQQFLAVHLGVQPIM